MTKNYKGLKKLIKFLLLVFLLLPLLSVSPVFAQESQTVCHMEGPIQVCETFKQMPSETPSPDTTTPPSEPSSAEISFPSETGLGQELTETEDKLPVLNLVAEERSFFDDPGTFFPIGLGILFGAIGVALFTIRPRSLSTGKRNAITAISLILAAALLFGGCYNYFQPIPPCKFYLTNMFGTQLSNPFSETERSDMVPLDIVTMPLVSENIARDTQSVRLPDESAQECYERCVTQTINVHEICEGEEPKIKIPAGTEKDMFCGAACDYVSPLEFLDEAPVGA